MWPQSPSKQIQIWPHREPKLAEYEVKCDKFHLLMNCKKLELYQTNLKTIVN